MSAFTLNKTLDMICTDYDYGIVPGSVTVFIRDSVENYGRFELTLLEGILLIIEVHEDGFLVAQCTPLVNNIPTVNGSLKLVQDQLDHKFDTLDKLLLTISPQFSQRYWEKHNMIDPSLVTPTLSDDLLQILNHNTHTMPAMDNTSSLQQHSIAPSSLSSLQQQQPPATSASSSTASTTDNIIDHTIFDWLH